MAGQFGRQFRAPCGVFWYALPRTTALFEEYPGYRMPEGCGKECRQDRTDDVLPFCVSLRDHRPGMVGC